MESGWLETLNMWVESSALGEIVFAIGLFVAALFIFVTSIQCCMLAWSHKGSRGTDIWVQAVALGMTLLFLYAAMYILAVPNISAITFLTAIGLLITFVISNIIGFLREKKNAKKERDYHIAQFEEKRREFLR